MRRQILLDRIHGLGGYERFLRGAPSIKDNLGTPHTTTFLQGLGEFVRHVNVAGEDPSVDDEAQVYIASIFSEIARAAGVSTVALKSWVKKANEPERVPNSPLEKIVSQPNTPIILTNPEPSIRNIPPKDLGYFIRESRGIHEQYIALAPGQYDNAEYLLRAAQALQAEFKQSGLNTGKRGKSPYAQLGSYIKNLQNFMIYGHPSQPEWSLQARPYEEPIVQKWIEHLDKDARTLFTNVIDGHAEMNPDTLFLATGAGNRSHGVLIGSTKIESPLQGYKCHSVNIVLCHDAERQFNAQPAYRDPFLSGLFDYLHGPDFADYRKSPGIRAVALAGILDPFSNTQQRAWNLREMRSNNGTLARGYAYEVHARPNILAAFLSKGS